LFVRISEQGNHEVNGVNAADRLKQLTDIIKGNQLSEREIFRAMAL
jgi:hypothetical protein